MIKGLSADNARPLPQNTAKRKPEKQDNFADRLMGAESEKPESLNRNERNNSGRGSESSMKERSPQSREGSRSEDREKDSRPSDSENRVADASRDRTPARERGVVRPKREREEDVRETNVDGSRAPASMTPPAYNHAGIATPKAPAIENSPNTDEDAPIEVGPSDAKDSKGELKLPDFFSKAALGQGAGKIAKLGGKEAAQSADVLAQMQANEGLSRQEAMEKFVARMDQLGVPPEKLLQAFAQLDDKAMSAPPEQSMGQFLKALDLAPKEEAKAGVLYTELIKTTGDSLMNERVAGMNDGVNFDVMSPRDASLRKLSSSLEDLNKSFFRKDGGEPKKAQKDLESMDLAITKFVQDRNAAAGIEVPQAVTAQATAQAVGQAIGQSKADLEADAQDVSPMATENAGIAAALANVLNQQQGGDQESDLSDLLGGAKGESLSTMKTPTKSALQSAFAEEMAATEKSASKDDDVKFERAPNAKVDPSQMLAQDSASQPIATPRSALMGPADMMMNRQATAQDEQDNVKDLIKQAQIMVKRGGGEMKMEMKPEGMGSIQLRVNVENGKVNVQMLTESESAKHLLEKGLSELKTNLAAHELKVQSLSVDVGTDVKGQMDHQATQDQARQHARQMASDFMSDFRDSNQGFRQGFMENKGWRSYAPHKGPDSLEPEQVARATATSRGDNSKRLNLVA